MTFPVLISLTYRLYLEIIFIGTPNDRLEPVDLVLIILLLELVNLNLMLRKVVIKF